MRKGTILTNNFKVCLQTVHNTLIATKINRLRLNKEEIILSSREFLCYRLYSPDLADVATLLSSFCSLISIVLCASHATISTLANQHIILNNPNQALTYLLTL